MKTLVATTLCDRCQRRFEGECPGRQQPCPPYAACGSFEPIADADGSCNVEGDLFELAGQRGAP